ncbi:hypothetical protein LQ938_11535 [Microbacterium sp. cx-55]|uniref:hypothetical protein n=1 Tax=Microbacterium sp. cx-55 TaxID=2875948 RepID=UPI001CC07482|nr:hypothetical protein [Microbacterium sp. cx-55]MBZ4488093.1 hypothetical protein [Microbacterium sp. cx-55]UGB34498.1 hypothetical protein LQ938_11535 [Microbacterium sp. cx-55]
MSTSCDEAYGGASRAYAEHLQSHPLYTELDEPLYEDGALSDHERALIADANAEYDRITDPIYDACSGIEDLYAGAYNHRTEEPWKYMVQAEDLSQEEVKRGFIFSQCDGRENRPACADFVLADWD